MSERDVRVMYNPRDVEDDRRRRRPRLSAALDSYDYPEVDQSPRRTTSIQTTADMSSTESFGASRYSRTTAGHYGSDDRLRRGTSEFMSPERSMVGSERGSDRTRSRREPPTEDLEFPVSRRESSRPRPRSTYSSTFGREEALRDSRPDDLDYPPRRRRSQDRAEVLYGRGSRRLREYVIDSSVNRDSDIFRREGNTRVMDTHGEVEIIMPDRNREKVYYGRGPNYGYKGSNENGKRYYTDGRYGGGIQVLQPDPISRRDRSRSTGNRTSYQYDTRSTDTQSGRGKHDEDDEWRVVDSMRDARLDEDQRRPRTTTQSSEDSYIMVSPSQDAKPTIRSAIRRGDYPPAELRRRRSRSISFRDSEILTHDAGDRRHERPGAEADISGAYLKRKIDTDVGSEVSDFYYQGTTPDSRRPKRAESGYYAPDSGYREPYPPQMDHNPRKSDRPRRHFHDEDDDDAASYFSEHVDKRYFKESRY